MKKLLILLVACLTLVSLGTVMVSGEGEGFDVVIAAASSDAVAPVGSEYTVKVSYENIAAEGGLVASDVDLYFDPAVLQFVSAEGCSLDQWKTDVFLSASTGMVQFRAADDSLENPVTASGNLYFTVTFKVLETAATATELSIKKATATTMSFDEASGTKGTLSVAIPQKLAAPTGLTWEGSVAKWDAVEGATGYSVQAYCGGEEVGDPQIASANSFDFKDVLTEGGSYTFTVIAVSAAPAFVDSDASAQSPSAYTVIGKLQAPKIKLSQDMEKGGLTYIITDTNAKGTVSAYRIAVYEKGSDTASLVLEGITAKDGHIPCDGEKIVAGQSYVVTVSAVSVETTKYGDSDASAKTAAVTARAKVVGVAIKTQPTLSYVEGDALDLSGLTVTLTYEGGTAEDVAYQNFEENGLTVSMKNGTQLAMKNSGKAITVYFGSKLKTDTEVLTVTSSACAHEHQVAKHQDPTCGDTGYDRMVCEDCGEVVSDTLLSATGEHNFSEWVVEFEPTPTMKGVKKHTCIYCRKTEYEEIEYVEVTTEAPVTTVPETEETEEIAETTAEVTEAPETEALQKGKTSDLFGVFLVIIIVIFVLVVAFIVGGIWLENRRKNARTANRNRRPPNREG